MALIDAVAPSLHNPPSSTARLLLASDLAPSPNRGPNHPPEPVANAAVGGVDTKVAAAGSGACAGGRRLLPTAW
jgi:hypothetical protein